MGNLCESDSQTLSEQKGKYNPLLFKWKDFDPGWKSPNTGYSTNHFGKEKNELCQCILSLGQNVFERQEMNHRRLIYDLY